MEARTSVGNTPVVIAAINGKTDILRSEQIGHIPVLEVLLSNGADIKTTDNDGLSVLHWAAIKGNIYSTLVVPRVSV